mmetsp:Transcript_33292/g.111102  ORF Transcript_33292/g.111102 Transcript_33292/m.111102 type:complete len:270 (-) Transcript_33292:99-908(-)
MHNQRQSPAVPPAGATSPWKAASAVNDDDVQGWFGAHRTVDVLFATLVAAGVRGAIVEIGVYHGKSFIHMAKHLEAGVLEPAVALDVFAQQEKNLDGAGKGDYDIFTTNMNRKLDPSLLSMISVQNGSSLETTPGDVLRFTKQRPVALFSVDACHTFHCTLNDLELARETLHPSGIIMVDDVFNQGWPGVMLAVGHFLSVHRDVYAPFAFGRNKYFIARVGAAAHFLDALKSDCGASCRAHPIAASWNPTTNGTMISTEGHVYTNGVPA